MPQLISSNSERQEDEVFVLSTILDSIEFAYMKKNITYCRFNIFTHLGTDKLEIIHNLNNSEVKKNKAAPEKIYIQCLPPIRFYVTLPKEYPSKSPPDFRIAISWLPPWDISRVCQKLDDIWEENKGNEVLLLWLEFLKNDTCSFLDINTVLDVSFMYLAYVQPKTCIDSGLLSLCDNRARNRGLFLNPVHLLKVYNEQQNEVNFQQKLHTCCICYKDDYGHNSIKLQNCNHIFCKDCMRQYIVTKISKDGTAAIKCPDTVCDCDILYAEIQNLCPSLINKYEYLSLRIALNSMNDIVYCPKNMCQYPMTRNRDESLGICDKCFYSFCIYCRKAYHGVAPCEMASVEQAKLINEYNSASMEKKKLLEKRYGRRQIRLIVEKHLSTEYIKKNTKPCPKCHTCIEKIGGCNKMYCVHCQASFCWLCGMEITSADAYNHFVENRSTCYRRLFEGMVEIDEDEE